MPMNMFQMRHGVAPAGWAQGEEQLTQYVCDSNTHTYLMLLHENYPYYGCSGVILYPRGLHICRVILDYIEEFIWGEHTFSTAYYFVLCSQLNGSNGEATNTDDLDHADRVRLHREAETNRHRVNPERGANRGGFGPFDLHVEAEAVDHVIDVRPIFSPDDLVEYRLFSTVEHHQRSFCGWLQYTLSKVLYIFVVWALSVGSCYVYYHILEYLFTNFPQLSEEIYYVLFTTAPFIIYSYYFMICWVYKRLYVPEFDIVDFYSDVHNYGGRLRSDTPLVMLPSQMHQGDMFHVRAMPSIDYNYYRVVELSQSMVDRFDRNCHVASRSVNGLHDYVVTFIFEQVSRFNNDEKDWWDSLEPNTREDYKQAVYQKVLTRMIRVSTYSRDTLPQFRSV